MSQERLCAEGHVVEDNKEFCSRCNGPVVNQDAPAEVEAVAPVEAELPLEAPAEQAPEASVETPATEQAPAEENVPAEEEKTEDAPVAPAEDAQ